MSFLCTSAVFHRASPTMFARVGAVIGQQARGAHYENTVGHNMPFVYTNKRAFTVGYWSLVSVLFAIPFVACKYQMIKSGHN